MTTIGIYDSGIGGLTTLSKLIKKINGVEFYYLADNKNMPFGSKTEEEVFDMVFDGITKLEGNSDCSVLACNTASVITNAQEVFKLMPNLKNLSPEDTLVLATPLTITHLKANENFYNTADTKELATLIEIQASINYKSKRGLDMTNLEDYLYCKLSPFTNIKNVVLGCSHYIYIKPLIRDILGCVNIIDGNSPLINEVDKYIIDRTGIGKVDFAFTGPNEKAKYKYILSQLLNQEDTTSNNL